MRTVNEEGIYGRKEKVMEVDAEVWRRVNSEAMGMERNGRGKIQRPLPNGRRSWWERGSRARQGRLEQWGFGGGEMMGDRVGSSRRVTERVRWRRRLET